MGGTGTAPRSGTALRALVCVILIAAPVAFGSVGPFPLLAIELATCAAAAMALAKGSQTGMDSTSRRWWLVAMIPLAVGLLQLVPLPVRVLSAVAPMNVNILEVAAAADVSSALGRVTVAAPQTVNALVRLTMYLLIAWATFVGFRRSEHFARIPLVLVTLAAAEGLYGGFEYLSGRNTILGIPKTWYLDSATGTFINRNHFAAYLAMALPLAVGLMVESLGRRTLHTGPSDGPRRATSDSLRAIAYAIAATCIVSGLLLSSSRAGLAAAVAGTALALLFARDRRLGMTIAVAIAGLVVAYLLTVEVQTPGARFMQLDEHLADPGGRVTVWKASLSLFTGSPLLGVGLGGFEAAFPLVRPSTIAFHYRHAHSDWIEALVTGGPLTLCCFVALVGRLVWLPKTTRTARELPLALRRGLAGSLAALALHSLVDFPLRIPGIAVTAAACAGLAMAIDVASRKNRVARIDASRPAHRGGRSDTSPDETGRRRQRAHSNGTSLLASGY